LSGVEARPLAQAGGRSETATAPQIHRASGRVQSIAGRSITLAHGPVPALQWPAMTMTFALAEPVRLEGLRVGSQVEFAFDMVGGKPTIRSLTRREAGH